MIHEARYGNHNDKLPGTDVMLFIFLQIFLAKQLAFLTQSKCELCKIWIITSFFEKNANFFAENCRKLQKIVIITSTPGVDFMKPFRQKFTDKPQNVQL
jgi:hypothetical protein